MLRRGLILLVVILAGLALLFYSRKQAPSDRDLLLPAGPPMTSAPDLLRVGFAKKDITPQLGKRPVYLAGFGLDRRATGIHDPLLARAVVFEQGEVRLALVSVDLVGLFRPAVLEIRTRLPGYSHIHVSSTHNHEGPDSMGLWGPFPLKSGLDPAYLAHVQDQVVAAVLAAQANLQPAQARLGTARAPELLHDNREPYLKHDELTALELRDPGGQATLGLIVNWHCHPETLDSKNTLVSADFVGATVRYLQEKHGCPVLYLTGTVGGLMTSLHVPVQDEHGRSLADGTFEKTTRYGQLIGALADRALIQARPLRLTPLEAHVRTLYLPLENNTFRLAWQTGMLHRDAYLWKGDPDRAERVSTALPFTPLCVQTEIAWLHLGELDLAALPGEVYPELVLGQVQDPPDPGADYPDSAREPGIYEQMPGPHRMLLGLACDELGYIIPRRQWDTRPPYCYGRKQPQYGEVNSLGPNTAPLLCRAFQDLVQAKR